MSYIIPSRHTDVTLLKATLLLSFFWSFERKTYTWSSPKSSKWNAALFIWNAALFIWNAALFIWKALHFSYEKHLKSLKTADSTQISHLDLVFHRVQREGHSWKAPLFMWKVPLFERPLARNCNPMFFFFSFRFILFIYLFWWQPAHNSSGATSTSVLDFGNAWFQMDCNLPLSTGWSPIYVRTPSVVS